MKKYDVIIVGGGPAGVAAARVLKQNHISFCIIEKEKFPRTKLCAGGLTYKSQKLLEKLDLDIQEISVQRCESIQLVSNKKNEKIPLMNPILMVNRTEFDYSNIKQVTENNLFESEKVLRIENDVLITDKERYVFQYIIFADGANGYSRQFIPNRKFGYFFEYQADTISDETIFDFSILPKGYGWVFPKKNHTTVGLGKFNDEKIDYRALLHYFSEKYHFDIEKTDVKGYPIPIYSNKIFKKSVIDDKYVLVGDAAALVDQVSGEGIYYALLSGKIAAESITLCLNYKMSLKNIYFQKTKKMYRELNKRNFLSKLLYSKYEDFFIKLGLSNPFFMKHIHKLFG